MIKKYFNTIHTHCFLCRSNSELSFETIVLFLFIITDASCLSCDKFCRMFNNSSPSDESILLIIVDKLLNEYPWFSSIVIVVLTFNDEELINWKK